MEKRSLKKYFAILLTFAIVLGTFSGPIPVSAATRKCYTISGSNTPVYSNSGLTNRYGTIYGSDELTVLVVTGSYSRVQYPISGGRTKTGYIRTSAILTATSGSSYKASARITTYRRPGGASYGYISRNDTVTVLGKSGNYTQVKYPVSGGYKYAFVQTASVQQYLTGSANNSDNSSGNVAVIANGTYVLKSALHNNKVLDADGGSSVKNGTNIHLWSYNGGDNQKYTISHVGSGWYKIICKWGNKALDVTGAKKGNEVNVELWDWNGGDHQLWKFVPAGNGYYYIQSKLGYDLDVWNNGTADGTNVQTYQFNGGDNQKWKLECVSNAKASSNQADALVNMAKSQVGTSERSVNSDDIFYNDWYYGRRVNNSSGWYPWCAVFVSWCANQAGITDRVIPKTASTRVMKDGLISRGGIAHAKTSGYVPIHGDIIFFGNNADQHVGIVDYTSGNTVYYIDGNNTSTTPHSVRRSSCSLTNGNIWGYVTPAYES